MGIFIRLPRREPVRIKPVMKGDIPRRKNAVWISPMHRMKMSKGKMRIKIIKSNIETGRKSMVRL